MLCLFAFLLWLGSPGLKIPYTWGGPSWDLNQKHHCFQPRHPEQPQGMGTGRLKALRLARGTSRLHTENTRETRKPRITSWGLMRVLAVEKWLASRGKLVPSSQPGARSLLARLPLDRAKASVNTVRETWCLLAGMLPNNALDSFTVLTSAAGKGIDLSFLPSARQPLSRCPQAVLSICPARVDGGSMLGGWLASQTPCYTPWALTGMKGQCQHGSYPHHSCPQEIPSPRGGQATTQEPPGTAILKMVGVWSPGTALTREQVWEQGVCSGGSYSWRRHNGTQ